MLVYRKWPGIETDRLVYFFIVFNDIFNCEAVIFNNFCN